MSRTLVKLAESATPETVGALRRRVAKAVSELGASETVIDAVKLCVSEAAANTSTHAYDGRPGPIEVTVELDRDEIMVVVRDEGRGLSEGREAVVGGYGLVIIEKLTKRLVISTAPGEGTEVRMVFGLGTESPIRA